MYQVSVIVVGAGLAGTTLAWALHRRGIDFVLLDKGEAVTSSRIAAGLMTPITGKRLTKTWRHDELFPFATEFYRSIEAETGASFYHPRSIVRIFAKLGEATKFAACRAEFGELAREPDPPLDADWFHESPVGFEMPTAAQLDVPLYLDASRSHFEKRGQYLVADVAPEDVQVSKDGVALPRLNVRAERIIFCQGFSASVNPLTRSLPFRAAKGEILTVRIAGVPLAGRASDGVRIGIRDVPPIRTQPSLARPANGTPALRILNNGHWLAPCGPELWRFGATYSWDDLTNEPTLAALSELEAALSKMLKRPFEVIAQQAAVRPIIAGQRPVLGFLHGSRVGVFNGLGSKGALLAPFFAAQFAGSLAGTATIDTDVDARFRCT